MQSISTAIFHVIYAVTVIIIDWNGDVATRVDMRTTKVKFFKKYLFEGMSDPGKIIRPGR